MGMVWCLVVVSGLVCAGVCIDRDSRRVNPSIYLPHKHRPTPPPPDQTELETAQRLAAETSAKLSALQQAHEAAATDAAAAKKEAEAAEASRSELLKVMQWSIMCVAAFAVRKSVTYVHLSPILHPDPTRPSP